MDDVATQLLSAPVALDQVVEGVPAEPGLYAWWAPAGAVPGVAGPPHPTEALELLYVGIAPSSAASRSTLRSRLVRDHIRGTTGRSTLRRSLAALLSGVQGWQSRWTTRPVLVADDEARLSRWMGEMLRVTWAPHPEPWTVERAVIGRLAPPLNQDDNAGHPLYGYVKGARARWRAAAAGERGSTRVSMRIAAPRSRVFAALLDPVAVARWRVPGGMTCEVHAFDGREGGTLRVSLTYDATDRQGKTTAHTDTYRGRFVRLVPDELVVEVDEFETADPALQGEMTSTITLTDAPGGGTDLVAVHEGLPPGVAPADNELGWRESLARLAALVVGAAG